MSHSITPRIASFIADAVHAPLDERIIEKSRHHIVDTLAAIISGTALHVGHTALAAAPSFQGAGEATVFGLPGRYPAIWAAMFNAMLAHADETDDSHERAKIHPGCAIVPTALAMAQRNRKSGLDLIRGVVAGYDIGARMTEGLGAMALNNAGLASHAFGALYGAGAAAGVLAGFDADQARRLLSYLAHETSGLSCWVNEYDHVQKAYVFGAMGAKNAITATLLCASGWTGLEEALEGKHALFETLGQAGTARGIEVPFVLGEEILGSNIKKWCVGSPVQAPLDCIEALIAQMPPAEHIKSISIQVRTDEAYIVNNRDMPNLCLQHLIALYVVDRKLSFESVHDVTRMNEPAIRAVRQRVELIPSDALLKAGGRQAILDVVCTDGSILHKHVQHVRGTWGDPMPRSEVDAKARDLIAPIIGKDAMEHLLNGLWQLEQLSAGELDTLIGATCAAIPAAIHQA